MALKTSTFTGDPQEAKARAKAATSPKAGSRRLSRKEPATVCTLFHTHHQTHRKKNRRITLPKRRRPAAGTRESLDKYTPKRELTDRRSRQNLIYELTVDGKKHEVSLDLVGMLLIPFKWLVLLLVQMGFLFTPQCVQCKEDMLIGDDNFMCDKPRCRRKASLYTGSAWVRRRCLWDNSRPCWCSTARVYHRASGEG
eukprot:Sspe_Gene.118863::Locus_113326_Transcript_1_1_Confidence_1.000_Length_1297::g.118863::m.118863